MKLTPDQQAMLDGEKGWPLQIAMQMLTAVGAALDAPDMISVTSTHIVIDGTALGEGGLGNGAVRALWGGDNDRLDLWIIDQTLPTVSGARKSIGLAVCFSRFGTAGRDHFQSGAQMCVEYRANCRHCHRMGFAHIATANNSYSDIWHDILPSKIALHNCAL